MHSAGVIDKPESPKGALLHRRRCVRQGVAPLHPALRGFMCMKPRHRESEVG